MTSLQGGISLFLLLVFFCHPASARTRLVVWHPTPESPRMIIPVMEGETPEHAATRYLKAVNDNSSLHELMGNQKYEPPVRNFELFIPTQLHSEKPAFAVLANHFMDHQSPEGKIMHNVRDVFEKSGADVFVIPVAADEGLSPAQAREYREAVAEAFDAMLALGGRDIDPSLYGKPLGMSHKVNLAGDLPEVELIRAYIHKKHGVLYGICRGHQLCAVAQGSPLIQDIATETTNSVHHPDVYHKIDVTPDESSLFFKFVGNQERVEVNSYHHQAVTLDIADKMKIVATQGRKMDTGAARIVEAVESADHQIMTVQFHPELMKSKTAKGVISGMVSHAVEWRDHLRPTRCLSVR